jgi:hypothetical protein
MIKNVVEGTVHPTTVTTSVTICFGAINEFLFREVVESFTSEGKGRERDPVAEKAQHEPHVA